MRSFGIPPIYSYELPIETYGLSLTLFELFSCTQKRVRSSARPSDQNTRTYTAVEATPFFSPKSGIDFPAKMLGNNSPQIVRL